MIWMNQAKQIMPFDQAILIILPTYQRRVIYAEHKGRGLSHSRPQLGGYGC